VASLPAAAQQGTLTACSNPYPRTAPYVLQKKAEQYAKKVVGKDGKSDPTEIRGGPTSDLVFWAIADAVAPDQVKRASERFKKIDLLLLQTQTEAETKSTDKQTGAGAKAQGSTSAVEKPDFPKLLSLAIENGTIQQESNGSTLTLSSSPYAFVAARQGDTAEVYRDNHDLTNIGASATFNITNADVPLANATRRQLAEWSVKYRFFDRSSRSQEFQNKWNQTVLPILVKAAQSSADQLAILNDIHTGKGLAAAYDGLFGYVRDYLGIHQGTSADLLVAGLKEEILCRLGADIHDATEVVEAALSPGDVASPGNSGALKVTLDKNTRQKIQMSIVTSLDLDTQVEQAHSAAEDILKAMQQKPLLTFVYTNVRGTTTPSYSVTKFLLEGQQLVKLVGIETESEIGVDVVFFEQLRSRGITNRNRERDSRKYRDFKLNLNYRQVRLLVRLMPILQQTLISPRERKRHLALVHIVEHQRTPPQLSLPG